MGFPRCDSVEFFFRDVLCFFILGEKDWKLHLGVRVPFVGVC